MDTRPIGIFDSGVGGLTVLTEIRKLLPYENIVYIGDTAHFPYGSRSKESIIQLTHENIQFLIEKNVKAIVIACGTATSQAYDEVKTKYPIPIIGTIEPTIKRISQNTNIHNVGIMATEGTIHSGAWERNLKEIRSDVSVVNCACPRTCFDGGSRTRLFCKKRGNDTKLFASISRETG